MSSEEWKKYKLGDIIEDIAMGPFGSNIKVDNFVNHGVPVIRGGNLNEGGLDEDNFVFITEEKAQSLRRSLAFPDDLVFTHRGTIGQVGIIPHGMYPKYLVSQSQMRLTVNKKILDPKFLYYFFKSPIGQFELLKNSSQVGVPAIAQPTQALKDVNVQIPNLDSQERISSILSTLDDKIELNRQTNATLEAIAQAVFKEWFVDFNYPGATGELVESPLGPIPKGWRVVKLGEISDLSWGDTNTTKSSYVAEGFPAYSASGPDGYLPYHDYSRDGIVVSAIGAYSGKTWFAQGKWSCIKNTIRFWSTNDNMSNDYLYQFTSRNSFWPLRGSAQPFISQTDARNTRIIFPDGSLSIQYRKIVNPMYQLISTNDEENSILTQLRESLLPKLMSGEIEV